MNKKFGILGLVLLTMTILTGCAAGAATAGYALKAQSADSLSAEAEQRIVQRAKRELMAEMSQPCPNQSY